MRSSVVLPALPVLLLLAGCESFFGVPKDIEGTIAEARYTAPDGSFSVFVPNADDDYMYRHMHVKEAVQGANVYASFGPTAFDADIYRAIIASVPEAERPIDLDAVADRQMATLLGQFEEGYGTPVERVQRNEVDLDGHAARHFLFRQTAPAGTMYSNADSMLFHSYFVIDRGERLCTLGASILCEPHQTAQEVEARLVAREHELLERFVLSFELGGPGAAAR